MFYGGLLWLFHCSDNINEPNQVATCRPKRLHWCWIILFAQSFNHYYLVFKHWRIYLSTFHGLQDFLDTGWWRQELWCRAISCSTQQSETYQENRPISFAGCTWKKLIKAMCIIFFHVISKMKTKNPILLHVVQVPLILRRIHFPCFLYSAKDSSVILTLQDILSASSLPQNPSPSQMV